MKISELAQKTNVPKETIHYYIREGALPRPRKKNKNTADYDESTVEQIRLIKDLQTNYFLPLSEIKKIIKKQKQLSNVDSARLKFFTENFRPVDQVCFDSVSGREQFMSVTGIAEKWLDKMIEWEILTPRDNGTDLIFSSDDVTIGKLIVSMDRLGVGPKDGYHPEDLKVYSESVKKTVLSTHMQYLNEYLNRSDSQEFQEQGIQLVEAVGLFFYHMYRKTVQMEINRLQQSAKKE